jgi:hypothetical protein
MKQVITIFLLRVLIFSSFWSLGCWAQGHDMTDIITIKTIVLPTGICTVVASCTIGVKKLSNL